MQTAAAAAVASSSANAAAEVDPAIWKTVAGAMVRVPVVNAYVYYFPQGHLQQCSAADAANNINYNAMRPWIPCQVTSSRYLSDPDSDQVFAKLLLQPLQPLQPRPEDLVREEARRVDDVVTYAKVLTRSDANNGGGFSVPRFCADMIFPELDFEADPPVQNLVMRDTHGGAWEFRHIYRGTPRRHLLTTGWSRFVNAKRLVAGDAVLFMKKRSTGELFVGIRRAEWFGGEAAEAVAAVERAVGGLPFEVVYYPKVGSPDFVVMAEKVKDALRRQWNAGMRVRTMVEVDDASRVSWIQGIITAAATPIAGIWCGSPWRMLKVNWDDPETTENIKNMNPWEVEYIEMISPLLHPEFHSSKKYKFLHDSGYLPSRPKKLYATTSTSTIFDFSQYFPGAATVGMQGARRYPIPPPAPVPAPAAAAAALQRRPTPPTGAQLQAMIDAVQNLRPAPQLMRRVPYNLQLPQAPPPPRENVQAPEAPRNDEAEQDLISVSTLLSIGSSYSDAVSPAVSQGSAQYSTTGQSAAPSFQLFGKTIHMPGRGDDDDEDDDDDDDDDDADDDDEDGDGDGDGEGESCGCGAEGCNRCT